MQRPAIHYRHLGVRISGLDPALRRITWPGQVGVGRWWRTTAPLPSGIHVAMKRWGITGPLIIRSWFFANKRSSVGSPTTSASTKPARRYYGTLVTGPAQTIEHGGVTFTVGRVSR